MNIFAVPFTLLFALVSPEQEKFVYAALASLFTAILASIGYFIKRKVEQKTKLD